MGNYHMIIDEKRVQGMIIIYVRIYLIQTGTTGFSGTSAFLILSTAACRVVRDAA